MMQLFNAAVRARSRYQNSLKPKKFQAKAIGRAAKLVNSVELSTPYLRLTRNTRDAGNADWNTAWRGDFMKIKFPFAFSYVDAQARAYVTADVTGRGRNESICLLVTPRFVKRGSCHV